MHYSLARAQFLLLCRIQYKALLSLKCYKSMDHMYTVYRAGCNCRLYCNTMMHWYCSCYAECNRVHKKYIVEFRQYSHCPWCALQWRKCGKWKLGNAKSLQNRDPFPLKATPDNSSDVKAKLENIEKQITEEGGRAVLWHVWMFAESERAGHTQNRNVLPSLVPLAVPTYVVESTFMSECLNISVCGF